MTLEYATPSSNLKKYTWMFWIGWILSILPMLMIVGSGVYAIVNPNMMKSGFKEKGWPEEIALYIALTEVACGILYLIPQTAVLGAILMTGYLGGAVGVHVRIKEMQAIVPIVFGIVIWLGLWLRDPRVRELMPLRKI